MERAEPWQTIACRRNRENGPAAGSRGRQRAKKAMLQNRDTYGLMPILFHWTIAALFVGQMLGVAAETAWR